MTLPPSSQEEFYKKLNEFLEKDIEHRKVVTIAFANLINRIEKLEEEIKNI